MGQLRRVGGDDEQSAADERGDQHGPRNGAPGVAGLLGQRGDGVEPDEGVSAARAAPAAMAAGVVFSFRNRLAPLSPVRKSVKRQPRRRKPGAREAGAPSEENWRGGGDPDGRPRSERWFRVDQRRGSTRPWGRQGTRAERYAAPMGAGHHREEEVVELDEPAREEPELRSHLRPDVSVGRTGHGIQRRHASVAIENEIDQAAGRRA